MFYINKKPFVIRLLCCWIILCFSATAILPPHASAQTIFSMPVPGQMIQPTPVFHPPLIRGIVLHPQKPFDFDFLMDAGDQAFNDQDFEEESTRLIKYFLASLTVPEEDLWVNLSPYEEDRIIPEAFGWTEMGRDLLAQDYLLKQITASLMYPETELGKKFWDRIYQKAHQEFGTTNIPINTFNKVWIIPVTAKIYEHENSAFITESRLKVMLEEDYLALRQNKVTNEVPSTITAQIVKEILIPEIEREVNEGEHFAQLRQVYHSLILASWYKERIQQSVLHQIYTDQNKVQGVDVEDKAVKDKIYAKYIEAFKVGVYDYIKEDYDPYMQEMIPRKYFSGGMQIAPKLEFVSDAGDFAMAGDGLMVSAKFTPANKDSRFVESKDDAAQMTSSGEDGVDFRDLQVEQNKLLTENPAFLNLYQMDIFKGKQAALPILHEWNASHKLFYMGKNMALVVLRNKSSGELLALGSFYKSRKYSSAGNDVFLFDKVEKSTRLPVRKDQAARLLTAKMSAYLQQDIHAIFSFYEGAVKEKDMQIDMGFDESDAQVPVLEDQTEDEEKLAQEKKLQENRFINRFESYGFNRKKPDMNDAISWPFGKELVYVFRPINLSDAQNEFMRQDDFAMIGQGDNIGKYLNRLGVAINLRTMQEQPTRRISIERITQIIYQEVLIPRATEFRLLLEEYAQRHKFNEVESEEFINALMGILAVPQNHFGVNNIEDYPWALRLESDFLERDRIQNNDVSFQHSELGGFVEEIILKYVREANVGRIMTDALNLDQVTGASLRREFSSNVSRIRFDRGDDSAMADENQSQVFDFREQKLRRKLGQGGNDVQTINKVLTFLTDTERETILVIGDQRIAEMMSILRDNQDKQIIILVDEFHEEQTVFDRENLVYVKMGSLPTMGSQPKGSAAPFLSLVPAKSLDAIIIINPLVLQMMQISILIDMHVVKNSLKEGGSLYIKPADEVVLNYLRSETPKQKGYDFEIQDSSVIYQTNLNLEAMIESDFGIYRWTKDAAMATEQARSLIQNAGDKNSNKVLRAVRRLAKVGTDEDRTWLTALGFVKKIQLKTAENAFKYNVDKKLELMKSHEWEPQSVWVVAGSQNESDFRANHEGSVYQKGDTVIHERVIQVAEKWEFEEGLDQAMYVRKTVPPKAMIIEVLEGIQGVYKNLLKGFENQPENREQLLQKAAEDFQALQERKPYANYQFLINIIDDRKNSYSAIKGFEVEQERAKKYLIGDIEELGLQIKGLTLLDAEKIPLHPGYPNIVDFDKVEVTRLAKEVDVHVMSDDQAMSTVDRIIEELSIEFSYTEQLNAKAMQKRLVVWDRLEQNPQILSGASIEQEVLRVRKKILDSYPLERYSSNFRRTAYSKLLEIIQKRQLEEEALVKSQEKVIYAADRFGEDRAIPAVAASSTDEAMADKRNVDLSDEALAESSPLRSSEQQDATAKQGDQAMGDIVLDIEWSDWDFRAFNPNEFMRWFQYELPKDTFYDVQFPEDVLVQPIKDSDQEMNLLHSAEEEGELTEARLKVFQIGRDQNISEVQFYEDRMNILRSFIDQEYLDVETGEIIYIDEKSAQEMDKEEMSRIASASCSSCGFMVVYNTLTSETIYAHSFGIEHLKSWQQAIQAAKSFYQGQEDQVVVYMGGTDISEALYNQDTDDALPPEYSLDYIQRHLKEVQSIKSEALNAGFKVIKAIPEVTGSSTYHIFDPKSGTLVYVQQRKEGQSRESFIGELQEESKEREARATMTKTFAFSDIKIPDRKEIIFQMIERYDQFDGSKKTYDEITEQDIETGIYEFLISEVLENIMRSLKPLADEWGFDIKDAFHEFIFNAIHAIRKQYGANFEKGKITLRTFIKDGKLLIMLTDNGTGIADSIIDEIGYRTFSNAETGKHLSSIHDFGGGGQGVYDEDQNLRKEGIEVKYSNLPDAQEHGAVITLIIADARVKDLSPGKLYDDGSEDDLAMGVQSDEDHDQEDGTADQAMGVQSDLLPVDSDQEVGGIDLTPARLNIEIERDGEGMPMLFTPEQLENMDIPGLVPVIINIQPVTNLPLLLGQVDEEGNPIAADSEPEDLFARKEEFTRPEELLSSAV